MKFIKCCANEDLMWFIISELYKCAPYNTLKDYAYKTLKIFLLNYIAATTSYLLFDFYSKYLALFIFSFIYQLSLFYEFLNKLR